MSEEYTKYERARLLGARALQISLGAPVMVNASTGEEPLEIAKRELDQGKLPLTVRRTEKTSRPEFPPV